VGGSQMIGGPVLVVPIGIRGVIRGRTQRDTAYAFFLPETLAIEGTMSPAEKRRTLFKVTVYTAGLKIRGRFAPPDLRRAKPVAEEVLWNEATLSLGVSDPKGISRKMDLLWNGQRQPFVPGVRAVGLFDAGLQASASLQSSPTEPIPFELDLEVRGTRDIWFLPSGNETTVQLTSSLAAPKFSGAPLRIKP
jgi:inner membrane protein